MLIAEELFLLLRRDDGKPENAFAFEAYGLVGAVLTDLLLAGRVDIGDGKDPVLTVTSSTTTGHPVLDGALARLEQRPGKKLSAHIGDGKLNPADTIAASLSRAEVIRVEEKKAFGLVPARYPVVDPGPEREVRHRLRSVLAGATPTPADGSLLSILQGLDVAQKVLAEEKGLLSGKELKARIEQISSESVTGLAVGRTVKTMNDLIMMAAILPAVTASVSS